MTLIGGFIRRGSHQTEIFLSCIDRFDDNHITLEGKRLLSYPKGHIYVLCCNYDKRV
jgi:hypothetical protein